MLKLDKANYMALVFIGKATAELGKAEKAFAAYKKAIAAHPDQLLAWQVGIFSAHFSFGEYKRSVRSTALLSECQRLFGTAILLFPQPIFP